MQENLSAVGALPRWGANNAPPDTLAGAEGLAAPPKDPSPSSRSFARRASAHPLSPLTRNRRLGPSQHDGLVPLVVNTALHPSGVAISRVPASLRQRWTARLLGHFCRVTSSDPIMIACEFQLHTAILCLLHYAAAVLTAFSALTLLVG